MAAYGSNTKNNKNQMVQNKNTEERMDLNESIQKVSRWLEVWKNEFIGLQIMFTK